MSNFDLTHARHDAAHCLAPGLFRSLKKGERETAKLNVVYDYGNRQRVEFSAIEPLGVDDLRVLQGLIALAGPAGRELPPEPPTDVGQALRKSLEQPPDGAPGAGADMMVKSSGTAIAVTGSYRSLAREIGYANPRDTLAIRDCVERLWKVNIIVQNGDRRQGFRLLSHYASDSATGRLCVALNPLIASAVAGCGQHVRIEMDEVRALRTDAARLIHQRLCGWINSGKSGRIGIDALCGYAWPKATANPNTAKTRRRVVRAALVELVELGWVVDEYATGKWEIKRPHPHANSTLSAR